MVKVTGGKAYKARLTRMTSPEAKRQVGAVLFHGAERIVVYAAHSLEEGSVSGKGHVPSLPGQPPNSNTQVLQRNIEAIQDRIEGGDIIAEASSNAPYAIDQEIGNSRLQARPYMAPAAAAQRQYIVSKVREAVSQFNKGKRVARGD